MAIMNTNEDPSFRPHNPSVIPPELPNIRLDRPDYNTLLQLLSILEKKPSSWTEKSSTEKIILPYSEHEINEFLLDVVMSSAKMRWLKEEADGDGVHLSIIEQQETLMHLASMRIAERCGRSACGEINRTWAIPAGENHREFELKIREPPLTGDNLGLKTWGSAYAIALKLDFLGKNYFAELLDKSVQSARILELGSGTGLVGIAASAIWGANVLLTDMEEIVSNLQYNIDENLATVSEVSGGNISGEVLNWDYPEKALQDHPHKDFNIILATDPMYDKAHPEMVSRSIAMFLAKNTESRVLVAVPMRDEKTIEMIRVLEGYMDTRGFFEIAHGTEICRDDWEQKVEENNQVMTKWITWRWQHNECNI